MFNVYELTNGVIDFTKWQCSEYDRSDAVFFCKVNRKSPLPDGHWEDDYYILYVPSVVVHKSLGEVVIDEDCVELMKRTLTDSSSVIVRDETDLKEVSLDMVEFD